MVDKTERDLRKHFLQLTDYFSPKVIGKVNDVFVKVTKTKGDDVPWHSHGHEDEMFYIVKGSLIMELENSPKFSLNEGEYFIVEQGIRHRVSSEQECWILLIENASTKHTGDIQSDITKTIEEQL